MNGTYANYSSDCCGGVAHHRAFDPRALGRLFRLGGARDVVQVDGAVEREDVGLGLLEVSVHQQAGGVPRGHGSGDALLLCVEARRVDECHAHTERRAAVAAVEVLGAAVREAAQDLRRGIRHSHRTSVTSTDDGLSRPPQAAHLGLLGAVGPEGSHRASNTL
jgi:hypothetical protein